jgi:bacterial/archaeal transporter family-2 protein
MPSSVPFLLAAAFAGGAALAIQAVINAQLRTWVGHPLTAALLSFLVGTIAIVVTVVAVGAPRPVLGALRAAPWWIWIGGLLGAYYIIAQVLVTPRVGATIFLALVIAGQLLAAITMDHTGALGLPRHPVTPGRLLGAACLVTGVVLLRRF